MANLPFPVPQSLATYVEQFDDHPEKATRKLEKHLKKRGLDAVGHFLLAWFHHNRGNREKAVKNALKAKNYAPGSPLMEHLHYYLVHPQSFDAWIPKDPTQHRKTVSRQPEEARYVLDLDALIAKLSQIESQRIKADQNTKVDGRDLSQASREVDDIVSETLAGIHEKQGKLKVAVESYRKLKKKNPNRSDYYDEQIARLEAQIEEASHKAPPRSSSNDTEEE
jgi:tetratricopeptide (TPR) repeat protein